MSYLNIENVYFKLPKGNKRGEGTASCSSVTIYLSPNFPLQGKHLLSRTMFIFYGICEMVIIFSILQALGISNKNTTEDINYVSFEEEDCSLIILLLELILFALFFVWLLVVIYILAYLIKRQLRTLIQELENRN